MSSETPKTGDRVRVVTGRTYASRIATGSEGTVVDYPDEYDPMREFFPVAVALDNGTGRATAWRTDELEVIES